MNANSVSALCTFLGEAWAASTSTQILLCAGAAGVVIIGVTLAGVYFYKRWDAGNKLKTRNEQLLAFVAGLSAEEYDARYMHLDGVARGILDEARRENQAAVR